MTHALAVLVGLYRLGVDLTSGASDLFGVVAGCRVGEGQETLLPFWLKVFLPFTFEAGCLACACHACIMLSPCRNSIYPDAIASRIEALRPLDAVRVRGTNLHFQVSFSSLSLVFPGVFRAPPFPLFGTPPNME